VADLDTASALPRRNTTAVWRSTFERLEARLVALVAFPDIVSSLVQGVFSFCKGVDVGDLKGRSYGVMLNCTLAPASNSTHAIVSHNGLAHQNASFSRPRLLGTCSINIHLRGRALTLSILRRTGVSSPTYKVQRQFTKRAVVFPLLTQRATHWRCAILPRTLLEN
jgi:hypothetical protein